MIKIGLTGGIGSGKSYVANFFSKLGIPVYNSDERGKHLMRNDVLVKEKLIEAFGPESFTLKGLNREFLSRLVFNDRNKLETINKIVHPAVQSDFEQWVQKNANSPYVIKEAAILIESGAYKTLNSLIVVTAPTAIRISRVIERDNMSKSDIEKRIANQMSDQDRISYGNFIINNDGIMLVKKQVHEIHNKILNNSE